MWRAASLHRKAITRATSSGSATRPNSDSCSARSSTSRGRVDKSSVFTNPGATAFTLTLEGDRKSTRLNSSHGYISYAVFCLKKKKKYHKHEYLFYQLPPVVADFGYLIMH